MFTIIGAMAKLESSLIIERVIAGMKAAKSRGKQIGRPPVVPHIIAEIERFAAETDLIVRQIEKKIQENASRGIIGEITKLIRSPSPNLRNRVLRILRPPVIRFSDVIIADF